jgi:predicted dehydrogenase
MDIGIIGCGLIGQKRANSIRNLGLDRIMVACDKVTASATRVAACHPGCQVTEDWRQVLAMPGIEAVVVATVHGALAEITSAALASGRHVLVEKPAARTAAELAPVAELYRNLKETRKVKCMVGFNHRFHPALQQARRIVDSGALGNLMFVRGRYGHGGRPGYEKEWRADPVLSGGGELLDQGMHLIDLSRWFLGDFAKVQGTVHTYFWDMQVDDNAFMTLETAGGQVAHLQVSWTEWKNLFSMEIYGRQGKLQIDGLGGSYGVERLSHYQMLPQMGPPETLIYEYPGADLSWDTEWKEFRLAISEDRDPVGDLFDAYQAHRIVDQIYRENRRDHR